MKKLFVYCAPLIAFLALGANVWATSFDALYVFGDSLSDAGNSPAAVLSLYKLLGNSCDPFHPCPPYMNGHYTNGPTAAEYLANAIVPGANFHSFAVSGATTGVGNFGDGGTALKPGTFGLPGMFQELALYISVSGGFADPNALYFVWGGANDLLTLDSPVAAAQNVAGYVAGLAMDGATHFLVPNLPNLGLTPFVQSLGPDGVAAAQGFSLAFNATLAAQLDSLRKQFPNRDITEFDVYTFVNNVVANPGDFGFTNAQDSCLSSQLVPCANPNQYVFWDTFHPTTQADAFIGAAFAASTVPEPGSLTLLVSGLIVLLAVKTQKRPLAQAQARKQRRLQQLGSPRMKGDSV